MYSKLALCLTNNIQSNFLFSRTIFVLQFHFLVLSFSTKWLPKCFLLTRIQFLVDRVINCFTQKISYSTLTSLIIKGFLNVFVLILRTKNLQGNKLKFAKYRVNSTKLFIFIFTICSTKNLLWIGFARNKCKLNVYDVPSSNSLVTRPVAFVQQYLHEK